MNKSESATEKTPSASEIDAPATGGVGASWWLLALASIVMPWISQPPLGWWPVALVAVVPLLVAATSPCLSRRRMLVLYFAATAYWALTLQGLRHANPLIYPCWIALAAYLAIYPVLFVRVVHRMVHRGYRLLWVAPVAWVGMECLRNYLLTGLSAAMLGHTLADVPVMIQIADLGGSYLVSFILVAANVGLFQLGFSFFETPITDAKSHFQSTWKTSVSTVLVLWLAAYGYGRYQLSKPLEKSDTKIALIGRNEPVEYDQDPTRELELFDAYAQESLRALQTCDDFVDAVVWPESMFTGTMPWSFGEGGSPMAAANGLSVVEEQAMIEEYQRRFEFRANRLLSMLAQHNGTDQQRPELLGGCGVVDYGPQTRVYSGIVHISTEGKLLDWYGKTHLVMFGEYIPVVKYLPIVKNWVPPNLGLTTGDGAKSFPVGDLLLCPNICIETAVERVAINHLRELSAAPGQPLPDAIVTVTNDAWFDDSSVVTHHKRCAQMVAVACRRPILSAANNGPTVWIDSCGRVVAEIPQGDSGSVIAQPNRDGRFSLMLVICDWPARVCAFVFLWGMFIRNRKSSTDKLADDETLRVG